MKRFVVFVLVVLTGFSSNVFAASTAGDLSALPPSVRLELLQKAEEAIIRRATLESIEREKKERTLINKAISIGLGDGSIPPDPEAARKIIISSDIDGRLKLEILELMQRTLLKP